MMKKSLFWKKAGAWLLVLAMVLGYIPGGLLTAEAAGAVADGTMEKVSDPGTVNGWTSIFGASTAYAGGVWTDKSVFKSAADYMAATNEEESAASAGKLAIKDQNFLVALSAMSSTKTVVGYDSIPTDTLIVLDMSSSMHRANAIDDLANATDDAINTLLNFNNNNRVGVVLYSSGNGGKILMPLDRYSTTAAANANNRYLQPYSNNTGIQVLDGVTGTGTNQVAGNRDTYHSGTFTQDGIYMAMKQLYGADKTVESGIQAGTERIPIIVLMSDGAPTILATDFSGNNLSSNKLQATSADIAEGDNRDFMTQVSGAYAKWLLENGENRYQENDLLFYTLGMGNVSDFPALLPQEDNDPEINAYWNDFLSGDKRVSLGSRMTLDATDAHLNGFMSALSTDKNSKYRAYVDQYFPASNASQLNAAFQSIVQEIILQSMYYPTLVDGSHHTGGYVEFHDYIGANMEVKGFKGIQLNDTLYTGANFARALISSSGSVQNPSDLGSNIVWAVQERLSLTGSNAAQQARDIIGTAYRYGQLAYNVNTGAFSNHIGWYSDTNGSYVASWDGGDTDVAPAGAAYAVKSYFFLDAVGGGHRETDMLYAMIQIRTNLESGVQEVHAKVPASLIPLVQYKITLNDDDLSHVKDMVIDGATFPTRLIYEVGLSSEIDLLDIENTAPRKEELNVEYAMSGDHGNRDSANGTYVFYTNEWQRGLDSGHEHELPDLGQYNTHVFFQPSKENERYYYHEDMPIYVKNGSSYSLYTGKAKPAAGGEYYRLKYVYSMAGSNVQATPVYEPITAIALTENSVKQTNNGWAVKAGTAYRVEPRPAMEKVSNETGTLGHYEHAAMHIDGKMPDGSAMPYHMDTILGNNGKLTLTPYQGVKVTKALAGTLADKGPYTFAFEADVAEAVLIKEVDGVRSESDLTFTGGRAEFELSVGETAWIVNIPTGVVVKITEVDGVGNDFEVSTVNGKNETVYTTTITAGQIDTAAFVNSEETKGQLTISKDVVSEIAAHKTDKEFEFQIQVSGAIEANDTFTAVEQDGTAVTLTAIADDGSLYLKNGTSNITLKHLDALTIQGLPHGTTATVTEVNIPNGFTAAQTELSTEVQKGDSDVLTFVNTYAAAPTTGSSHIDIVGTKTLVGPEGTNWNGSFDFVLEKLVSGVWSQVSSEGSDSEASVEYNNEIGDKTFTDMNLFGETYSSAGTYSYRIREDSSEALEGIVYDARYCYFDVVVTDDGNGQLIISQVNAGSDTIVTWDDTDKNWVVNVAFTNEYVIGGAAKAVIGVKKAIDGGDSGVTILPEGFQFALYEADADYTIVEGGAVIESAVTSSAGLANISKTYTQTGTYYYVLKEIVPVGGEKETENGKITYGDDQYFVKVIVDHDNSGEYAISLAVIDENGNVKQNNNPEDFVFEVAAVPVFVKDEESNVLTITTTEANGAIYYKVNDGGYQLYQGEEIVLFEGIEISAYVEADGKADSSVAEYGKVSMLADEGTTPYSANVIMAQVSDVTFTNTYTPKPAQIAVAVTGNKVLTGRELSETEPFFVDVYKADENFDVASGTAPKTVEINQGTGVFQLEKRDYYEVGIHYFVIEEQIPAGAQLVDGQYVYHGITYDQTKYYMTISVTGDNSTGKLTAQVTSLSASKTGSEVVNVVFRNSYKAEPTNITFEGTKTLTGRVLQAGMFAFELLENGEVIQTVTNDAPVGGAAAFAFALDYDEAGEHTYVIREQIPEGAVQGENGNWFLNGMTYSGDTYGFTVEVTDNGTGELVADLTEVPEEMSFANAYTTTPTSAVISGTKVLTGDSLRDGAFAFELYRGTRASSESPVQLEAAPIQTVRNVGEDFTFAPVEFEQVGTYVFGVKEQPGSVVGMTYDSNVYYVAVHVTDNLMGQLEARVEYLGGDIVFHNDIGPAPVSVSGILGGTKRIEGRPLTADDQFTFELYFADENGGTDNRLLTAVNNAAGHFVFTETEAKELTYTEAGTHYVVIREQMPEGVEADANGSYIKDGITYTHISYTVKIEVEEIQVNGRDTLKATVYVKDGETWIQVDRNMDQQVVFTNTYGTGKSDEVTVEIIKTLNGKAVPADVVYSFSVYGDITVTGNTISYDHNAAPDKVITTADPKFAYTYEEARTYYYVVKEQIPSGAEFNNTLEKWVKDNVCYDPAVYLVKVDVTDDGLGKLIAATPVFYQINVTDHTFGGAVNALVFANDSTLNVPDPKSDVSAAIGGAKKLANKDLTEGEFTFNLFTASRSEVGVWTKNKTDSFLVAHNTKTADREGTFSFTNVSATGTYVNKDFVIEEAGWYYYIIEEQIPTNPGDMIYDAARYGVAVYVDQDQNGKLFVDGTKTAYYKLNADGTAAVINAAEVVYNNTYNTQPSETLIEATKHLNDKPAADELTYSFKLYENVTVSAEGVVTMAGPAKETVQNAGSHISFSKITYTDGTIPSAGRTYYYVVEEAIPAGVDENNTLNGVTYDDTKYLVEILVVNHGGTLTVTSQKYYVLNETAAGLTKGNEAKTGIIFNNETVRNIPDEVGVEFGGTKELVGKNLTAGDFTFKAYAADEHWTKMADTEALTAVVGAEGKFAFTNPDGANKAFVVTEPGHYHFVIEEVMGSDANITYDPSKFHVAVNVVYEDATGALKVDGVTYSKVNVEGGTASVTAVKFTNVFDTEETTAEITANKTLNGEAVPEDVEFSFNIYSDVTVEDGKVTYTESGMDTVTNNGGTVTFGTFTYDDDDIPVDGNKTWCYVIEEVNAGKAGVVYDDTKYLVTVVVSNDNGVLRAAAPAYNLLNSDGTIGATVTKGVTFKNTTDLDIPEDPGNELGIEIGGTKVLVGKNLTDEEFTFELYRADEDWEVLAGAAALTATNHDLDSDGLEDDFVFTNEDENPAFIVNTPGEYYFLMKEQQGSENRVTYDTAEYRVTVTVAYNTDGALEAADISYVKVLDKKTEATESAVFTNTFDAHSTETGITAQKTHNGVAPESQVKFDFELYTDVKVGENGKVTYKGEPVTVQNTHGVVDFGKQTLEKEQTYYFVVKEALPEKLDENNSITKDGVTIAYDDTEYLITVVVKNNTIEGKLYVASTTYNKIEDGKIGETVQSLAFANTAKTNVPENPKDPTEPTLGMILSAKKSLQGGKTMEAGDFTFEVYTADRNWVVNSEQKLTASNQAPGQDGMASVVFSNTDPINEAFVVTTPGTYHYVIKEVPGSDTNVAYDGAEFRVAVEIGYDETGALVVKDCAYTEVETVTDDAGSAAVTTKDAESVVFTNVFTPDAVPVSIEGEKIFKDHDGKKLTVKANDFQFALYETDSSYQTEGVEPTTVYNDGNGKFRFDLNLADTTAKYYVVKEVKGSDTEIHYSTESYNVAVTVSNDNGVLVPAVVITNAKNETVENGKLTFTNTKETPRIPDPIDLILNVEKELKNLGGGKIDLRNFKVELVDEKSDLVQSTKRFDEDGETFFKIHLTNANAGGTYTYILREVDTKLDGVVYSTKEYEIKISVTADNGELTAQVWVDGRKVTDLSKLTFRFTNIYHDPGDPYVPKDPLKPTSPDTGDEGSGLWIVMLILSSLGFILTAFGALRKRRYAR